MPLDKRSTLILHELMNAQDYVFANDLMQKLNVSRRTIYYDLEKINSWLSEQQLQQISRSYSKGFYLNEETKSQIALKMGRLQPNQYFYTKDERVSLLGVHLILKKDILHLQDLMEETGVSRVTTYKDLESLKQDLVGFELAISYDRSTGYTVCGNENRKRKALAHYLTRLFAHKGWNQLSQQIQSVLNPNLLSFSSHPSSKNSYFEVKGLSDYYTLILDCETSLNIELTDEMLRTLALNIFIICRRLEQGLPISLDEHEKSALCSTPEFLVAQSLASGLEKWHGIRFPVDEICFLTIQLLSAKVVSVNTDTGENEEIRTLKRALKNMIFDFQKYGCVFFKEQEELEKLMFIHLKPAYYRIKYDVFAENPLTENIKNQYHEVFQITKKVVYHLEDLLGKKLNEGETAYIAMYFGGWMRRQGSELIPRQRAIIVCETGLGTSNLLRIQLEQLLSTVDIVNAISLRDYQQHQYDVDMFFTTISLQEKNKPVFLVNPILNDIDKRQLLSKIQAINSSDPKIEPTLSTLLDVIQKNTKILDKEKLIHDLKTLLQPNKLIPKEIRKPMLHELLTEDMIQFKSNVENWEEAIRVAANPLLKRDYITENYIDAMVQNVKNLGPYIVIVPNIAIPHARPEHGVKKLGMSLLCLDEPINFSSSKDLPAQLVIVLAAVDNEAHLKALSQLTTFLADEEKVAKVLSASSPEEVTSLLRDIPVYNQPKTKKEENAK